jgi:membrane protein implicated in regulation of membrane protease activity
VFSDFLRNLKDDWEQSDKTLLKIVVVIGTLILTYVWLNAELWVLAFMLGAVHLVICSLLFTSILLNFVSVYHALVFATSISVLAMVLSWGWVYGLDTSTYAALAAKTSSSAFGSVIFGLTLRLWLAIKNS